MKIILSVFIISLCTSAIVCLAGINDMESIGQGEVRYLGFIKVYEATLYTQTPVGGLSILDKNTSKCLQLEYSVSLSIDDFILGADTILSRQHSTEKLGQLKPEIDRLHKAYRNVQEGDKYLLCYDAADQKTTLALNDQELAAITSADFGAVYFGIWLGPVSPIDEKLRNNLLAYSRGN